MENINKVFAAVICLSVFCSCSKNKAGQSEVKDLGAGDVIEIHPVESKETEEVPAKWSGDYGVVFVIFGYGYNDKDFVEKAEKLLSEKYGLLENGGLVKCIRFPEDLHNRISNLRSMAENVNLKGIVVLGAPEGSHYTFASIRDSHDNSPDINIFSFFPQDDVLGQEGTCSFVLDQESAGVMKMEEEGQKMDKDIFSLLVSSVRYAAILPGELPSDSELHAHVQTIAGKRKVHRYVDGESGIQSRNHFVMEAAE
ncbi:MAG: hypothetical protein UHY90_08915 [Treponema sp.]|nr:hypothetical protein [Treponema sp.]